ncbi:hypothetical protein ACPPVT_05730 [Angustibacter sp. McL0619]|uniref:hypothetical protein n=1 Tax=Angustibacter sp. McL0619 TaxID=3415676 RepID=UPI003CE93A83
MPFEFRLSSGAFGLPAAAMSVDWLVLNDTGTDQQIRVTVFAAPVGSPKHQLPPGPIEVAVPARTLTHNANSVGPGQPFEPGIPVEVVVQCNDLRVLPTVEVWQDNGGTVIAGTRIGPGDFVRLVGP